MNRELGGTRSVLGSAQGWVSRMAEILHRIVRSKCEIYSVAEKLRFIGGERFLNVANGYLTTDLTAIGVCAESPNERGRISDGPNRALSCTTQTPVQVTRGRPCPKLWEGIVMDGAEDDVMIP